MDEYEKCIICGGVIVENMITKSIYCKLCGWSPQTESEQERPGYIG